MNKNRILFLTDFLMLVATLTILAIAIIAAAYGNSRPDIDSFFCLVGIFIPVIIIFSIVLTTYWSIRRSFLVLLPLLSLVLNYNSILSNFQFRIENSKSAGVSTKSVRICTYNIHEFLYNKEDLTSVSKIADFVKSNKIDIICFQEFNTPIFLNADELNSAFDFLHYNYIKKAEKGTIGMAIYSRFPIIRTQRIDFENTGNGIIWADIKIDPGKIVRLINNHLQTTNYSRNRHADVNQKVSSLLVNSIYRAHQADVVRAIIDTTTIPVIVCGDFNDIPTSYTFSTIKGENLTDGFREAGSWFGSTFRGMGGLLRIDYILHSKEFKSIKYSNPNIDLSDHRPIISELVFRY